MKSLLLGMALILSQSTFANINAPNTKVDILEVLNVILKPIQDEAKAGTDISQSIELGKFMEFLLSGSKFTDVTKKVVSSEKTVYLIDNVECVNTKCSKDGAYYIVTVETKNGTVKYSTLKQNH